MAESQPNKSPVILVVDDEKLLRLLAADILESAGFGVMEAENASAALRVLERRPDVRLVFTDIHMPGPLDGMELARQVHKRWPGVLVVLTSGQTDPRRADIANDGRFIAKPYRAEELVGQVHELRRCQPT
jgi:two-component system, response regulator PdtaR